MSDKYFIANGNKVIGHIVNTNTYCPIIGSIDSAARFKKTDGERFIMEQIDSDERPLWTLMCVTKRKSGSQRYIITNATNFAGNAGAVKHMKDAKGFRSIADAEAFIKNRRDIMCKFGEPFIVNDNLDTFERSAGKTFTDEQLNYLGFVKSVNRVSFSPLIKNDLYDASGHRCSICGKPISRDEFTVDHIVPLSRGGKNKSTNLRCVCNECNQLKNNLLDSEMYDALTNIVSTAAYRNPGDDNWKRIIRAIVRGTINSMDNSVQCNAMVRGTINNISPVETINNMV